MPFFFTISGMLFKPFRYPSLWPFIQRRLKTLVRPYVIFSLTVLFGFWIISPVDIVERSVSVLLHGWGGIALWFIPVLFLTSMLFWCVCKISRGVFRFFCICFLGGLGVLSSFYVGESPYNVLFVCTAVVFYGVGNLFGGYKDFFATLKSWQLWIIIVASFAVSLVFMFNHQKPEFFVNKYIDDGIIGVLIMFVTSISGTVFFCASSYLISKWRLKIIVRFKNIVKWFGRNSYVVLAFHQIILLLLSHFFHLPGTFCRIIMWGVLVMLILAINRYTPWVLGRERVSVNETRK